MCFWQILIIACDHEIEKLTISMRINSVLMHVVFVDLLFCMGASNLLKLISDHNWCKQETYLLFNVEKLAKAIQRDCFLNPRGVVQVLTSRGAWTLTNQPNKTPRIWPVCSVTSVWSRRAENTSLCSNGKKIETTQPFVCLETSVVNAEMCWVRKMQPLPPLQKTRLFLCSVFFHLSPPHHAVPAYLCLHSTCSDVQRCIEHTAVKSRAGKISSIVQDYWDWLAREDSHIAIFYYCDTHLMHIASKYSMHFYK